MRAQVCYWLLLALTFGAHRGGAVLEPRSPKTADKTEKGQHSNAIEDRYISDPVHRDPGG